MTDVLAYTVIEVSDLLPDGAVGGRAELLSSKRLELGPALGRVFDDLTFDQVACAACGTAVAGLLVDDGWPVWLTVVLVTSIRTGHAWVLCEDCGACLDPDPAKCLPTHQGQA